MMYQKVWNCDWMGAVFFLRLTEPKKLVKSCFSVHSFSVKIRIYYTVCFAPCAYVSATSWDVCTRVSISHPSRISATVNTTTLTLSLSLTVTWLIIANTVTSTERRTPPTNLPSTKEEVDLSNLSSSSVLTGLPIERGRKHWRRRWDQLQAVCSRSQLVAHSATPQKSNLGSLSPTPGVCKQTQWSWAIRWLELWCEKFDSCSFSWTGFILTLCWV